MPEHTLMAESPDALRGDRSRPVVVPMMRVGKQ